MGEKAGEAVHTYPLDFPLLREEISASKDLPSSSASYSNGFLFYLFVSSSCNCIPWRDSGLLEEIKQQLGLAAPMIAASLLQFLLQLISLMFAGHLGELALAGASMATFLANVTGFSLLGRHSRERNRPPSCSPWLDILHREERNRRGCFHFYSGIGRNCVNCSKEDREDKDSTGIPIC